MKKQLAGLLALALLLGATSMASADDKKDAKPPAMSKEEAAMMEAYALAAQPGEPHKKLAEQVGTWDAAVKTWTAPGKEPMTSTGITEIEMILGGRYQKQTHKGEFSGMPFEGFGLTAWDNVQEKYSSVWIDNMGTGLMVSDGKAAKDGKSVKYEAKFPDPLTKKMQKYEEILRLVDANNFVMEMWTSSPKGKKFMTMEITYKRKK